MSTKTLRKRIALVAVSAMGFGLLTSVSANAATSDNTDFAFEVAATQPGVCSVTAPNSNATSDNYGSAVVVSGSAIKLNSDATNESYLSVAGNATITSGDGEHWDTVTSTTAYANTASDAGYLNIKAGAVGTATITYAQTDTSAPKSKYQLTIVSSCDNTTFDATNSYFQAVASAKAATSNVDETTSGLSATVVGNNSPGYITFTAADVYGDNLPAGKAMIATVKSGNAYVSMKAGTAASTTAPSSKTAIDVSTSSANGIVKVVQSVANQPTTAVVEVTYNGVVIGSKTFNFEGPATKINVTDVTVGKKSNFGSFRYSIQDDAGNYLRSRVVSNDGAVTDGVISSGLKNAGSTGLLGEKSDTAEGRSAYKSSFGCTSVVGKGKVGLKYTDPDTLATVKTSFDAYCGGALDTWSISTDKATYSPGEIATLTVTGKDSKGNPVNYTDTIGTVEYSFGGMSFVTAPTTTDKFTSDAGVKTYKMSVGTTEGSFVGTFKIAGATDVAAKTVQYKIAAGGSSISNAEVLAAIVKLIASINKQIAALQKLLTKKK